MHESFDKKKRQHFSNIDIKNAKPYFSEKRSISRKIALVENVTIITNDKEISKPTNVLIQSQNANTNANQITSTFENHSIIKNKGLMPTTI